MFLRCLRFGDSKKEKKYPTVIEELCHHFSFEALRKSTNDFDEKLKIGEGGFGKVYKGCLKHNNGDVTDYSIALKVNKCQNSIQTPREFKTEIEMLCQLRHPNIISLMGFCYQQENMIVVYEYMANGSLHDYLSNKNKEPLSWKKRLEICIGVARALHYLHAGAKRCIVHCDIKPQNILLDRNMVPKLSDFGFSLQGSLSDKCDVYSFGMVLLHLVGHNVLHYLIQHEEHALEETMDPILNGKVAPDCWQVFASVIQSCLDYEADERPTMGEVEILLEHALSLQQQADDITNINAAAPFTLLSTTHFSDIFRFSGSINNGDLTSYAPMEGGLC
ncbi:hypothetical protein HN51_067873 [Arachis hypogaea]|uniref:receptor-like protein kinase FERONIA n=1 Tax=Arachis ipaensis TaxID=130454 RepID=UPI000A2B11AE|nr:receptor-like protein kinase FERONIA [Arachis ipaensis]XP_025648375.1 receptor-like protein kinase FERONIA [Arachis hypogaea]